MNQTNVYDLPTRIIHWSLAILFLVSFSIGNFVDDESILYPYHMLSGIVMTFLVLLRIGWGFIGTKYAKFKNFKLSIKELFQYFSDLRFGKEKKYVGHNPASSFAGIIIFILILIMSLTGFFMVQRIGKELFEEIHEMIAFIFALVVTLHIIGVFYHELRHRDKLAFSMLTGKKFLSASTSQSIKKSTLPAMILMTLIVLFVNFLGQNYNAQNGTLNIFGKQFNLLEEENKQSTEYYNNYYEIEEGEDD